VFLASGDARYNTGVALPVDAGNINSSDRQENRGTRE
jgi:hypothetical protein